MQYQNAERPSKADEQWTLLYAKKLEAETVQAIRYFRTHGVEPILVKGCAVARYYPAGRPRFFSDIDLSVSESHFELADSLRGSEEGLRYAIDLHRELRGLDTRPWQDIFNDCQDLSLDGYEIRIPSDEDHLRIIATHWLLDGGENQQKLWDIFFAVQRRPETFDWDKCLSVVSSERRTWVISAIGAAHRYLGLEIDDLPFADEAKALPKWFIRTLEAEWRSGIARLPLTSTLRSPRKFFLQLRKRLPPNPIRATIESEGNMFSGSPAARQFKLIGRRARPSISKVMRALLRGPK